MTKEFLIFTLVAPMASFGELAGHERRKTRERPGKAALLGMIGAALGIYRDDSDGQMALADGYDIAVRVEQPGHPMQDFHTIQAVPSSRIKNPQTRAIALQSLQNDDNAILTRRDYRTDVIYGVAITAQTLARWSLEEIKSALQEPYFTLYLGRKSCPLSHPLNPEIITATNIKAALNDAWPDDNFVDFQNHSKTFKSSRSEKFNPYIAISKAAHDALGQNSITTRMERVNDQPLNRIAWHFTERYEVIHPIDSKKEPS